MKLRSNARGFSLIEVLIALIVMSVGMLGIAGLYVHGLKAGRTSLFRHHAVTLAGDVADRIRANPHAGAAYAAVSGTTANNCIAGGKNCTPAELAASDIALWLAQAGNALPTGDVDVTYAAGVPSNYTVKVTWSEPGIDQPHYEITFPVYEM